MKQDCLNPSILKRQCENEQVEKLFTAIHNNQLAEVKKILSNNEISIDIREQEFEIGESKGDSVLHAAARLGDIEMFVYLSEKGANINSVDSWGNKPLHIAAKSGGKLIVCYLLDKGAKINERNAHHRSPLDEAISNRHLDIVKLLIDKGAFPNNKNLTIFILHQKGWNELADLIKMKVKDLYNNDPHWTNFIRDLSQESTDPLGNSSLTEDE